MRTEFTDYMKEILSQVAPEPAVDTVRENRLKALVGAIERPGKAHKDPRVVHLRKIGALKVLKEVLGDDLEPDRPSKILELVKTCRKSS